MRRFRGSGILAGAGVLFVAALALLAARRAQMVESAPPSVVLVSMDGFRWDYPDLVDTPSFDRLAASGVRAEALIPPFPSKTFPSHYTMVTGLYTGHHGLISNNVRDPRWDEVFGLGGREEVENPRWWGGEPIWVTAQKQGLRSGVYFWPGSEAAIQGMFPTWWYRFDGSVPFRDRVDRALEWLAMPVAERPAFVALYLGEPNTAGHTYGPESTEAFAAVRHVDAMLGRLLNGLEAAGTLERTNIVVVSDHGMALNDPERVIVLDDFVELLPGEVFEQGALLQLFPRPGREQLMYEALHDAHPHLAIYRRGEIPERLHLYDNLRLPPILGTPDPGWEVVTRQRMERDGWGLVPGDHGQDPEHPDMQGIFFAAGPAFAQGVRVGKIESVDVYNLLAHVLGIEPAPNDGDWARVRGVLRQTPIP